MKNLNNSPSQPNELFAPLLASEISAPVKVKTDKETEPQEKPKLQWRQVKQKLTKAMASGSLTQLKACLIEHPEIKETKFWKTEAGNKAVGYGSLELCQYLLQEGAPFLNYNGYSPLWRQPVGLDRPDLMEFLLNNKLLEWPVILQKKPRCVELLELAPKVTKYLQTAYGFDVGVGVAINASKGELKYLGNMLLKAMIRNGLESTQTGGLETTVIKLRATSLGKMSEMWNEVAKDLWLEQTRHDKVEQLHKLLQAQVKPDEHWMIALWYEALDSQRWQVLQWLNKSPKLIKLAKLHWPYNAKGQGNNFHMTTSVYPSKAKIKMLLKLGFDVTAKDTLQVPWIHQINRSMGRSDLRWVARKIPTAFDSTDGSQRTLIDKLEEPEKLMVTKEMLDKQLSSRRKKKPQQARI